MKQDKAPDPDSHAQPQPDSSDDREYIFKLQVYPSYLPEARGTPFTLTLPVPEDELKATLSKHGINDFGECDVASCECPIKRLSNTLNLEGNIYGLNQLAVKIKDMIGMQGRIAKFLDVLEVAKPSELSDAIDCMEGLERYESLPQNIKTTTEEIKGMVQELNM